MSEINAFFNISKQLTKGSEAYIYQGTFLNKPVIIKERREKIYRHPTLDKQLRINRTKLEARILKDAYLAGLPVPVLLGSIPDKGLLIIEYIGAETLGKLLLTNPTLSNDQIKIWFTNIGELTGKLHSLNIVHGDLTIFNILVSEDNKLWIIDFGLAFNSNELEQLASDIFTFENTLKAFKHDSEQWFDWFLEGYTSNYVQSKVVLNQLQEIYSRGRYIQRSISEN